LFNVKAVIFTEGVGIRPQVATEASLSDRPFIPIALTKQLHIRRGLKEGEPLFFKLPRTKSKYYQKGSANRGLTAEIV